MRHTLLNNVVGIEDTHRRIFSTLREYNTAQGYTPAGDGPSWVGQVRQWDRDLGTELNRAAPDTSILHHYFVS
jgi:hypothetical protein